MKSLIFASILGLGFSASAQTFGNAEGSYTLVATKADSDGTAAYVKYQFGTNTEVKLLSLSTGSEINSKGEPKQIYTYSIWSKAGDLLVTKKISAAVYQRLVAAFKILYATTQTVTDQSGRTSVKVNCPVTLEISKEDFSLTHVTPKCSELPESSDESSVNSDDNQSNDRRG